MNYKTLMIHEVQYNMLDTDKYVEYDEYTFDDCLFSQFYYFDFFKKGTLFICPSLLSKEKGIRKSFKDSKSFKMFPTSVDAMYSYRIQNRNDNYMTLDEIKYLLDNYDVEIGGHSFYHDAVIVQHKNNKELNIWRSIMLKNIPEKLRKMFDVDSALTNDGIKYIDGKLKKGESYLKFVNEDTEKLCEWFDTNFGYVPKKYCFPFNKKTKEAKDIIESYGFNTFYGDEREDICKL